MAIGVTWPLVSNVIRRNKTNHTFGYVRRDASGAPKAHQGWDLSAKVGTDAYAIADGEVALVRNAGDYGSQLSIRFELGGATYYAFYAHMQHIYVKKGDRVSLDDLIATTGKSGNARSLAELDDHLHFEIRRELSPGLGLGGRVSPFALYGICPIHSPIAG